MTTGHATRMPRTMRPFTIIWLGQLVSLVGSGLTSFALAVWIYQQTQQATPFALTVLFGALPRVLLSPLAGALADRWNRRWQMILSDTGCALVTFATVLLLATGSLHIWHIYVIALLNAVFSTFQEPAYLSSITMLVPREQLGRANGMMQMGQSLEPLVAPLLAGVLFPLIGLQGIILIDVLTFFIAVAALSIVRIPQPVRTGEDAPSASVWSDMLFGWRYLRARAGLFGLLLYFALVNFLFNTVMVLTGPLVLSFSDATVLGVIQTVLGGAMLAGSIAMSVWGGPRRRIHTVIGFITLAAVGLFITGLRSSPFTIGGGLFLLSFSIPFAAGASQSVFQSKVAAAVQGRVFALRSMIAHSMMPLAFLLAGPLADRVFGPLMSEGGVLANTVMGTLLGVGAGRGIGLMFVLSGLILVVVSAITFASPRIRHIEDELPDAVVDMPAADATALVPTISPEPAA